MRGSLPSAEKLAEEFDRTGVLVLPDFIEPDLLQEMQRACDEYFRPIADRAASLTSAAQERTKAFDCDVVPWFPMKEGNAAFTRGANMPEMDYVTTALLGPNYYAVNACMVMFSVGGGKGQAWHQDCPHDGIGFNLNRLVYTEEVTLERGAIVVVPGSHRWGRIPPGGHQEPIEGEVVLTPTAGTLILLHGHVFHRVTPNLVAEPRISVNYRAYPAGCTESVTCIGVYRNGTVDFCEGPRTPDDAD